MQPVMGGLYGAQAMAPAQAGLGLDVPAMAAMMPNLWQQVGTEARAENTTKKVWWIVGGLVLAAGAAVGGWALWKWYQKRESKGAPRPKQLTANKGRYYRRPNKKRAPGRKAAKRVSSKGGRKRNKPSDAYRLDASMKVQTLIFPKTGFDKKQAVSWAKQHGYKTSKVDETGTSFRLRQKLPGRMGPKSFRTIAFGDSGIKAVVAKGKKYAAAA